MVIGQTGDTPSPKGHVSTSQELCNLLNLRVPITIAACTAASPEPADGKPQAASGQMRLCPDLSECPLLKVRAVKLLVDCRPPSRSFNSTRRNGRFMTQLAFGAFHS